MLVVFVTPFYKPATGQFMKALAQLPGVELAVVSAESEDSLPHDLKRAGHWRVEDALAADQVARAVRGLTQRFGPAHRLLAVNEQAQVPAAYVREWLDIPGMGVETMQNFRDKARMKTRFRESGVPCSRHRGVTSEAEAWDFVNEVGFPVCVKPVDGAAAQATYRVDDADDLHQLLRASSPRPDRPLQVEEFVVGDEHSFETLSLNGEHHWHSLTHYSPTPLNVVNNPWIQWQILLPKEIDEPRYDDVREVGIRTLNCLGMQTGITHLEWFRRADGSLAVGEVAARPPGAQLMTLMNRANDIDLFDIWSRMMVYDQPPPPIERRYAAGVAFLRGLGGQRVHSVRGLEGVLGDLGEMATDMSIPTAGQPAGTTYEGEGYVVVRHPETERVREALSHIISNVRVELV